MIAGRHPRWLRAGDDLGQAALHGCGDEVSHGRLTLTGEVDHEFESERAHRDVFQLTGVAGLTNEIKVKTQRLADAWWRS